MPGMTLSVKCSTPTFQVTLKGGCDEGGIFEMNKEPHWWKMGALDYALGRLLYDVIWEDGLSKPVSIHILYSTVLEDSRHTHRLISKHWNLEINPSRWLTLPKSRHLLKKIQVKWQPLPKATPTTPPPPPPPTAEFRLAVASIPLKVLPVISTEGVLDLALVDNKIIVDGKLNFSQVFNAWLVFDADVDWTQWTTSVTYWLEIN
jgi:hypothetical protein